MYALLDPQKQFTMNAMGNHYSAQATFAKQYNPYLYYFPFPMIVSFAAYSFYPAFFSNGTYGAGGVANYESISSIIGAKYSSKDDAFIYVPERWPANWYRRATPYTAVQALTDGLTYIYAKNPITPGFSQLGTPNANATTLLCNVYQGINSITPLILASELESAAAGISWALALLDPYFGGTALGCPGTSLSPNYFYPNATSAGGPAGPSPPPAYVANAGNNVYNKIYFTATPTSPLCKHTTTPKS